MAPPDLSHVLLPVPNLKNHKSPDGKEDMLRTIIKNIDAQQQHVRNNIAARGIASFEDLKRQQQEEESPRGRSRTRPDSSSSDDPDAMDMDDTPSDGEIVSPRKLPTNGTNGTNTATANATIIANLNAPYREDMGDPCVPSDGSLPAPPRGVRQATPPLEIKVAKEIFDEIAQYDAHAKQAKQHYEKALERMRRGSAPTLNTNLPNHSVRGPEPASAVSSRHGSRNGSIASPIDASRDPRRRR